MSIESLKIVIVGDRFVGKTCLWNRLTIDECPPEEGWEPEQVENRCIEATDGETTYNLKLLDTAGYLYEYTSFRPLFYPQTNVVILCFALDNPGSYSELVNTYFPEVRKHIPKTPVLLVGTKTDLEAQIPIKKVERLKKKIKADFYVECSPLQGTGKQEVIDAVINTYKNHTKNVNKKGCSVM